MKKFAAILAVLLLFIPTDSVSQQPILLIELSSDGEATVTQLMSAKSIVSSISVPLISDRTSKILATDERGILLKTTQSGDSLNIATLGASGVTLTYKADITSFDSQVWNVSYEAETETVVSLPQLATIVSVSSIPLDIEDNAVIMPPGPVSITYTINEVSSKTFFVLEAGQNYPVEITSASKIDDFFKQSNEIRFRISSSDTLLVVVPSIVLPNPIGASLNGGEVSFNPYYQNGTHNWIRIDPHESGVIEIGGDVRASQIISDTPMTNDGSGENDSIFLTVGIILGVLAVGYVIFRKYFKIGLVRTSSSNGSNRLVKSKKHVKKNVKGSHIGIFALAFLTLLLTVPSAFADEYDPDLAYNLMISISDGRTNLENLEALIEDNNFTVDLSGYADALDEAAGLVAIDEYAAAQLVLEDAEIAHDDIYNQFYEQIEEQQDARFDEYVETAKSSLNFIIENGPALGLTQPVIDQLATTLQVLEYGTDDEIDAATGGNSQIGITLSVLPSDLSLPSSFTTGSGAAEQLKSKLPPGIAKKYGYSTDNDLGTESSDYNGDYNGDNNDDDNNDLPKFFSTAENFIDLEMGFPGLGAAIDNNGQGPSATDGIGLGLIDRYDIMAVIGPDGEVTFTNLAGDTVITLPEGIAKKFDPAWIYQGYSPDSEIGGDIDDNAGLTEAQLDAIAEYREAQFEAAQEAAEAESEAAQEAAEEAEEEEEEEEEGGGPPCPPKC